MANCDICNTTVSSGCYALHSDIVLNNLAYIEHYISHVKSVYGGTLGMSKADLIKGLWERLGPSVWIVCDDCIRMFPEADLPEARLHAQKFWAGEKTLGSRIKSGVVTPDKQSVSKEQHDPHVEAKKHKKWWQVWK